MLVSVAAQILEKRPHSTKISPRGARINYSAVKDIIVALIANILEQKQCRDYVFSGKTNDISGPFCGHGFNFNFAAWKINYVHYNVWDEITYPFLNVNGATVEV